MRDIVLSGQLGRVLSTSLEAYDELSLDPVDQGNAYLPDVANGAHSLTIHAGHYIDPLCFGLGELTQVSAMTATSRQRVTVRQTCETLTSMSPDRLAAEAGPDPAKLLVYSLVTVIVDETDAKVQAEYKEDLSYASYDGSLVLMSGWSGVDMGRFRPTDVIRDIPPNPLTSMIENLVAATRSWTVEDLARFGSIGGVGQVFVGSAATVADALQQWVEETDIDGFILAYAIAHETFDDVVTFRAPRVCRRTAADQPKRPFAAKRFQFGGA